MPRYAFVWAYSPYVTTENLTGSFCIARHPYPKRRRLKSCLCPFSLNSCPGVRVYDFRADSVQNRVQSFPATTWITSV